MQSIVIFRNAILSIKLSIKLMSKRKTDRDYWYSDIDILQLLMEKSENNVHYKVIDSATHNYQMVEYSDQYQIVLRITEAVNFLRGNNTINAAVIPINLGNLDTEGSWEGRHWVGLIIRRAENGSFSAFYSDSLGRKMSDQLPFLKEILHNNNIDTDNINDLTEGRQQQTNLYDCGPWTVINLDHIARNGQLLQHVSQNITEDIIQTQRQSLHPYYDDSSDEERDGKVIYEMADLKWLQGKFNGKILPDKKELKLIPLLDLNLSFLLHEIAIRLIKSNEVNAKYYPQKRKKLQKTLELRKEDFEEIVTEGIKQTLIREYGFDGGEELEEFMRNATHELLLKTQKVIKEKNQFITSRKSLSELVLDDNYMVVDWVAGFRLVNCSSKRTIRNQKDEAKQSSFEKKEDSYTDIKLSIPYINQHVTIGYDLKSTGSKKSLVKDIGSYNSIKTTIKSIKACSNLTDQQIADLVLGVLNNTLDTNDTYESQRPLGLIKVKKLMKYIANLTTLLFFEEAHRNPAALLEHQMMLELIKFTNLDWDRALEIMPMAPKGATSAARWINANLITSVKYRYDARDAKFKGAAIKKLFQSEAALLQKWLEFKQLKSNDLYDILELLLISCRKWYKVDLTKTFLSDQYLQKAADNVHDVLENRHKIDITLAPQELISLSMSKLRTLSTPLSFSKKEWSKIAEILYNYNTAEVKSDIILLILNYGICTVKGFLLNETANVKIFLEYGLNIFEIFDLYQDKTIDENDIDNIVSGCGKLYDRDEDIDISNIIHIYKNDRKLFERLVKDAGHDNGVIEQEGIDSLISKIEAYSALNKQIRDEGIISSDHEGYSSYDEVLRDHQEANKGGHYHSDDSQNMCYSDHEDEQDSTAWVEHERTSEMEFYFHLNWLAKTNIGDSDDFFVLRPKLIEFFNGELDTLVVSEKYWELIMGLQSLKLNVSEQIPERHDLLEFMSSHSANPNISSILEAAAPYVEAERAIRTVIGDINDFMQTHYNS